MAILYARMALATQETHCIVSTDSDVLLLAMQTRYPDRVGATARQRGCASSQGVFFYWPLAPPLC